MKYNLHRKGKKSTLFSPLFTIFFLYHNVLAYFGAFQPSPLLLFLMFLVPIFSGVGLWSKKWQRFPFNASPAVVTPCSGFRKVSQAHLALSAPNLDSALSPGGPNALLRKRHLGTGLCAGLSATLWWPWSQRVFVDRSLKRLVWRKPITSLFS